MNPKLVSPVIINIKNFSIFEYPYLSKYVIIIIYLDLNLKITWIVPILTSPNQTWIITMFKRRIIIHPIN